MQLNDVLALQAFLKKHTDVDATYNSLALTVNEIRAKVGLSKTFYLHFTYWGFAFSVSGNVPTSNDGYMFEPINDDGKVFYSKASFAEIVDGTAALCLHGLCNSGTMKSKDGILIIHKDWVPDAYLKTPYSKMKYEIVLVKAYQQALRTLPHKPVCGDTVHIEVRID